MPKLSPIQKLLFRVRRFIQKKGLTRAGEKWLVGVSGGPDSVCLLHLLYQMREELGIFLHAAHLNHGLRGEEAEADAQYVAALAERLAIPFSSGKKDVLVFKKQHHCSLEEAAREVRYLFFYEETQSHKAEKVVLAHTADDQAETVLLHLIRGSGGWGLRGMAPWERWHSPITGAHITVVRPLLETSRSETEFYCQAYDLQPRYDATNRSPMFLRNRLRSDLLPLLKSFNPKIQETLTRTSQLISQEQEALEALASPLLEKLLRPGAGKVTIDIKGTLSQPIGLQRYLLRSALASIRGNLRDLEAQHIEKMRLLLSRSAGKKIHLPGHLVFYREYNKAILSPEVKSPSLPPLPAKLMVPGEVAAFGYQFRSRLASPTAIDINESNPYRIYLDARLAGNELLIRTRRPGDRFQPLGMMKEKKLQDFMVDARIPQRIRHLVPLVCSPRHIIWVVGFRMDERVKITEKTKEVLVLEASPLNPVENFSGEPL